MGDDRAAVHGEYACSVVGARGRISLGFQKDVLGVHTGVGPRHTDRCTEVALGGDLHGIRIGRSLAGIDVDAVANLRGDLAVADYRRAARLLVHTVQV